MLNERFGYREFVQLDEFGDDLLALKIGFAVIALVLEAFADFFLEIVEGGGVADILGELIVELGKGFGLDAEDVDGVMEFLVCEFGVGIIGRIFDVEILVVADVGAAEIFVEGLHGFFGADVAQDAVRLQRIAAAVGSAEELDLNEIAVLHGASFDGRESCGSLLHFGKGVADTFVRDIHLGHFDFERFVIAERKFGEDLEACAELERLALLEIELVDLRLGDRSELLLGDGLFDVFGDEGLQDFALDVVGEAPFDEGNGSFAGSETGDAGDAGKLFGNFFRGFGNFLGRNFQVKFSAASGFRHIDSPLSG
jgi:hypothetical protein